MSAPLDTHQHDREPIDTNNTDRFDLDKKSWRTVAFVLVLLAATIVMIVSFA